MIHLFSKVGQFDRDENLRYAQTVSDNEREYLKMYIETIVLYLNNLSNTVDEIIDYLNELDYKLSQKEII